MEGRHAVIGPQADLGGEGRQGTGLASLQLPEGIPVLAKRGLVVAGLGQGLERPK